MLNNIPIEIVRYIKGFIYTNLCYCNRQYLELRLIKPFNQLIKLKKIKYHDNNYEFNIILNYKKFNKCYDCNSKNTNIAYKLIIEEILREDNYVHHSLIPKTSAIHDNDSNIINTIVEIMENSSNILEYHKCCNNKGIMFNYFL